MPRRSQLDLVARVVRDRGVRTQRASAEQLRLVEQNRRQLSQLLAFRDEYSRRFAELGSGGLSGTQISEFRVFLGRIDEAIALQNKAIQENSENWRECQRRWQSIKIEEESINAVVTRREREHRRSLDQEEQKRSDAGALLSRVTGMRPTHGGS